MSSRVPTSLLRVYSALAASVCMLLLCVAVDAQTGASARPKPGDGAAPPLGRDPGAIALRDKLTERYRELKGLREKITQKQWKESPAEALTVEIDFRFRKPNQLFLSIDYPNIGKPGRWQLVYACNGKNLTVYNSAKNTYQIARAPSTLERIVLPQVLRGPEFPLLLRDFNPLAELDKIGATRYTESLETSAEGAARRLTIEIPQDGAKRTLTYRLDPKTLLIRELTIAIVSDGDNSNPFVDPEVNSTVSANYTLVEANPRFTHADFDFAVPVGATETRVPRSTDGKAQKK